MKTRFIVEVRSARAPYVRCALAGEGEVLSPSNQMRGNNKGTPNDPKQPNLSQLSPKLARSNCHVFSDITLIPSRLI